MNSKIIELCKEYINYDVNQSTKKELQQLIDSLDHEMPPEMFDAIVALNANMNSRLAFGTAGLRGRMGIGYNKMNELVILQTTQGLIHYLENIYGKNDNWNKSVVIGYDHRQYDSISSESIALICAEVFLMSGYKVYFMDDFVPTPFVAFGVGYLHTTCGIMITASHNPKEDNGFKLYWRNASQIIPPHDSGIAQSILSNLMPWKTYTCDRQSILSHPNITIVTSNIAEAYFQALSSLRLNVIRDNCSGHPLVLYTAMHGVGAKWISKAFDIFHLNQPVFVEQQKHPDPNFPTVRFPNPEEKGALDLAIDTANSRNIGFIIANDPDADRFAMAEKVNDSWRVFSGNEIGSILGHWMIMRWKEKTQNDKVIMHRVVLASIVSSRQLKAIALAEGIKYYDTLTGFKWLGNKSIELQSTGDIEVLFSYEEALGFCVGNIIVDKDGISAACVMTELMDQIHQQRFASKGIYSLDGYLASIYKRYGRYVSYNSYIICEDKNIIHQIFHALRHVLSETELSYGKCYGNQLHVVSVKDITIGYDSTTIDLKCDLPMTPDSQMIMYEFDNQLVLTLRTSGTEPKIKFYSEYRSQSQSQSLNDEIDMDSIVRPVIEEMLQLQRFGLSIS